MSELFWIPKQTYLQMCALGEQSFPLETGGILLGYEADNGEAVVTAIIGPGQNAKHRRYRFSPDAEYQQAELTAHHLRTNGRETYLGDWHTHPRGSTALSLLDKKTLTRIACTASSGTVKPVMAILGGGSESWEVGVVRFLGWKRRFPFNRYDLASLSPQFYESSSNH